MPGGLSNGIGKLKCRWRLPLTSEMLNVLGTFQRHLEIPMELRIPSAIGICQWDWGMFIKCLSEFKRMAFVDVNRKFENELISDFDRM